MSRRRRHDHGPGLAWRGRCSRIEAAAILGLVDRLDGERSIARCSCCFDCRGRVIVTGMGKSGIICRKIAATLSSTAHPPSSSIPPRRPTATSARFGKTTW